MAVDAEWYKSLEDSSFLPSPPMNMSSSEAPDYKCKICSLGFALLPLKRKPPRDGERGEIGTAAGLSKGRKRGGCCSNNLRLILKSAVIVFSSSKNYLTPVTRATVFE